MTIDLCSECTLACKEGAECKALLELRSIYAERNKKQKAARLAKLRGLLGVTDAETAPDIKRIANKIINTQDDLAIIKGLNISIGYVRSYERKGGLTMKFADCRKVPYVYQAYLPYDFIITIYESNAALLSDTQRKILIYHVLKHIDMGDRGPIVRPHDVEDFHNILDEYGTRWNAFGKDVPDILE